MLLSIRQLVVIPIAVAGMILRLGLQRAAGFFVMAYRVSDKGLVDVIEALSADEGNKA